MHFRRILKQVTIPLLLAATAAAAPGLAAAQQQEPPSHPTPHRLSFPHPMRRTSQPHLPPALPWKPFLKHRGDTIQTASGRYGQSRRRLRPESAEWLWKWRKQTDPQHQVATATFLVTPDGKHLIANNLEMLAFGEHPFAETRDVLMQRANGPSRGAAEKKFELVEFADFQCPHCKATQPIIERLLADFPQAHFVFENFPLTAIHSEAYKAAAYSVCVAQQAGDAAFFKFADNVFNNQENLTPNSSDAVLSDAATKAGLDGAKVGACSYTQAAKDAVDASIKLGKDLYIDETPMLFINGRQVPVGEVANHQLPYETLKQMVEYQFKEDQ